LAEHSTYNLNFESSNPTSKPLILGESKWQKNQPHLHFLKYAFNLVLMVMDACVTLKLMAGVKLVEAGVSQISKEQHIF